MSQGRFIVRSHTQIRTQAQLIKKYQDPHKVIKSKEKHFIIETLAVDEQTVSNKRLKSAIFTHAHDKDQKTEPD